MWKPSASSARRPAVLAATTVACVALLGLYVAHTRSDGTDTPRSAAERATPTTAARRSALDVLMGEPHILFRQAKAGSDNQRVEVVPVSNPHAAPTPTPLFCERVDMAGGAGLCGTVHIGAFSDYQAEIFDRHFQVLRKFPLQGIANRIRVSPDGAFASTTEFVYGDSYAATNFSTRAEFIDMRSGVDIGNLEAFTVTQNGNTVGAINRNYWGVTFGADSDRFYASQAVGSDIRMIEGRISTRTARTVARHVECPSLSPDGTRIAYKLRSGTAPTSTRWRLHVLDLRSGKDHALAETRSVDDQVEWLDDATVLYALPRSGASSASDVWSAPADGSGHPALLIPEAASPSVAR